MVERTGAAPRLPPSFRAWVAAAAVSDAGVAALYVALGWAATSYGGTAAGLVVATITATRTLLLLVGGTVADRFGPRVVMLFGDGLLLLFTGGLAVAAVLLDTPLWLLFVAAAAEGVVSAFYLPASSSMTRRLVDSDLVGRASALRGATSEAAEVVGSPVGGILAVGGFGLAAGVDAVSYIPILFVMLVLRPRRVPEEEHVRQSLWRAAASGVVLVARHPVLRVAIGLTALAAGAVVTAATLLIPLVVRSNGWPPTYSGVLLASSSVSGIVVALLVSQLGTARRASLAATAGLLMTAAGLAVLGVSSTLPFAILAVFAAGGGVTVFTSHTFAVILQQSPDSHLSRVQSLLSLAQAAVLVPAAPLLGRFAATAGTTLTLGLAGAALALVATAALAVPAWRRLGTNA